LFFLNIKTLQIKETLKHLITPAASFKEYKKITNWSFEVYLIQSHDGYDPLDLKEGGFDFDKFKKEILKLTESSEQEFSFVLHVLDQKDDPALSMAFQTSLHTANVVSYQLQGKVVNQTRTYLDSDHLRHQLVKLVSRIFFFFFFSFFIFFLFSFFFFFSFFLSFEIFKYFSKY